MKSFSATVTMQKFVPGGQALGALDDGRKVFVWGALPGETARVEIYKLKKSYAEAIAVEILSPSPNRIAPRDACHISTSPWQILDYDFELKMKADLVREAFRQEGISLCHSEPTLSSRATSRNLVSESSSSKVSNSEPKILENASDDNPIITDSRDFFYRNKMEYSLWWQEYADAADELRQTFTDKEIARGGKIFLAFHKRGSHQKIPITHSSIERPEIFAEAQRIIDDLNSRSESARKFQSLLIRCNQNGEISSALFEKNQPHPTMKNLTDDILGQRYSYSPNGFFQINLPVYEMALQEIACWLGNSEKVVDMYAGVGTIGLSVARDRELTLVETDENAFRELKNNIASLRATRSNPKIANGSPRCARDDNITAIHAKSEEALQYITNDITLILDPPRAGLDEKVISRIRETLPQTVIYLSCNPATQARDIAKLTLGHPGPVEESTSKYQITHQQAFNFFPRTPHIENLIVLQLK